MCKRNPFVFALAALVLMGLASCLKTVTNNNTSNPSSIAFVNVVPNGPSFGVFVDGSSTADSVGNNHTFPYASYDSNADGSLKYFQYFAGIHSVSFNDSAENILVSGETQFSKNTKYTIFLYDTLTAQGLNAVQLQDTWDSIPYGHCLFRFLNFSPNAPIFNVYMPSVNDSVPILTGQAYVGTNTYSTATLSQYLSLVPGTYTFAFTTTNSSGAQQIVDTVRETLLSGKGYTLIATGLYDSTHVQLLTKALIKMN
jgi:hypothetical protein